MSVERSLQFVLDQKAAWRIEHPDTVREALKLGADAVHENKSLRAEVNHLRAQLGMGRKYVEWNEVAPKEATDVPPVEGQ